MLSILDLQPVSHCVCNVNFDRYELVENLENNFKIDLIKTIAKVLCQLFTAAR